jgi:hypothetical protein
MDAMLTTHQTLAALRGLEPRHRLTYQQLRDLERRGCVAPRAMRGGRAPRVYDAGDVMLLRLVARMQADPLLVRWQTWSVVAHLREELRTVLLSGQARTLVVQGAVGQLLTRRDAATVPGVPFELSDVRVGVYDVIRAESGPVWTGSTWLPASQAAGMACSLAEVFAGT